MQAVFLSLPEAERNAKYFQDAEVFRVSKYVREAGYTAFDKMVLDRIHNE